METPPFYRLTRRLQPVTVSSCDTETRDEDVRTSAVSVDRQTAATTTTSGGTTTTAATSAATTTQLLDRGQIHTKRHSNEDPAKLTSTTTELLVLVTATVCLSVCHTLVFPCSYKTAT